MPRQPEDLNGGLVTSRDPAKLQPGEMSALQNAEYRVGSQALQRAKGRAQFGQVLASATAVVGLRDVLFDNGNHYLIAHASNVYQRALVGDTGSFVNLDTVTSGSSLEKIHFANRFYLLNGANDNRVVYLSATASSTTPTARRHGMLPVEDTPDAQLVASTFSQDITGYYDYWTTESMQVTTDGKLLTVEGTFTGKPATIFVNTTASAPRIRLPSVKNPEATHWLIYRSTKKERQKDQIFPTGFLAGKQAIASATAVDNSFVDTLQVASASSFPASANNSGQYFGWANPLNATAGPDTNFATVTLVAVTVGQGMYGFNFGGFTGNVRGITVEVRAAASVANTPMSVIVGAPRRTSDGGFVDLSGDLLGRVTAFLNAKTAVKSFFLTSTSQAVYTLGGSADPWLVPTKQWSDSDFNPDWMAVMMVGAGFSARTVSADYIKATVHYAAAVDTTIAFPSIVIEQGDVTAAVGRNGPPPVSSTGDVFEDHMVVNDVANPSQIRWSTPGDPESFPPIYSMDFETPDNAAVTFIRTLNNRVIVALTNWIFRINYLPEETDANFSRGRCKEVLSNQIGIVNPMCGCTYTDPDGQQRLAGVSDNGIFSTNGFDFQDMTADLKWSDVIATANSRCIALVNDPTNEKLLFYFRNDSLGSESYRRLGVCYGSEHTKGGRPKIDGPVFVRNKTGSDTASLESAWSLRRSTGRTGIYTGYGGTGSASAAGAGYVYFDTGSTIPANDPAFGFTTRRIYAAGLGNEFKQNEVYYYLSNQTGTQTLTATAFSTKTNDTSGEVNRGSNTSTIGGQIFGKIPFSLGVEGLRLQFAITSGHDDLAMESIVLDGENFGEEDSGK